jgi:hypothetical protein
MASIIVAGVGAGLGPSMSMRSIDRRAGVSFQSSNPCRMNSFLDCPVVGSQLASRRGPPTNSSTVPSADVSTWSPVRLVSGTSPNGSCRTPGRSGRAPWTVTLKNGAVPRDPVMR